MLEQTYNRTPLWVYGHSFTKAIGEACDPGEEWMPKLASKLGMPSWNTYGVSSSRMIDIYSDIARTGYASPQLGSMWSPQRNGLVVVQAETNDVVNPPSGANTSEYLPGLTLDNYMHTLICSLAILSASELIDLSNSTPGGTWGSSVGTAYSNGALTYTTQAGAFRELNVDIGPSGIVWLICWDVSDDIANPYIGDLAIHVDGVLSTTLGARTAPWDTFYSHRSGIRNVGPRAVKISGLPKGVHKLRFTKTDSGPGALCLDQLAVPADEAPPVIVVKDPMIYDGTSWAAAPNFREIERRNRKYLHGMIEAAVAYFPNAITASLSGMRAEMLGSDGIHPNNLGMTYEADVLERAFRSFTEQYSVDRMYV